METKEFFDYCRRIEKQFVEDHGIDYMDMIRSGSHIGLGKSQSNPQPFPHDWTIDVQISEGDPQGLLKKLPKEGEKYKFGDHEFIVKYHSTHLKFA